MSRNYALSTICLTSVFWCHSAVCAATGFASAAVGAVIVSSAQIVADASTQLLVSSTTGVLVLSIPGGGGSAGVSPSTMELTTSGPVTMGISALFFASNSAGLAALITRMTASGGTLTTSGTLSGTGVQIVVLAAAPGSEGGTVTAIVTYN